MLVCEACGNSFKKLVIHHWYELPDFRKYQKDICLSCNAKLISRHFYNLAKGQKKYISHILPNWETQVGFIKHTYTPIKTIIDIPFKKMASLEKRTTTSSVTTTIRLPLDLIKHIEKLAAKRQLSFNKYVVNALIKYTEYKEENHDNSK